MRVRGRAAAAVFGCASVLASVRVAAADPAAPPVAPPAPPPAESLDPPVAPKQLGVDATVIAPLSPWRDAVGTGGGGAVWVHVPISPLLEITASLGAIVHAQRPVADDPAATARLSEIPLLGGARYRVTDGPVRAYLEGQVGLIFARVDARSAGITDDSAAIRLGSALGAAIEVGRFDLRVAVWFADLSDLDHAIGVTASVGVRAFTF